MPKTVIIVYPEKAVPKEVYEALNREWSIAKRVEKLKKYLEDHKAPYLLREYNVFLPDDEARDMADDMKKWFEEYKNVPPEYATKEVCYVILDTGYRMEISCDLYDEWKQREGKEIKLYGVKHKVAQVVKRAKTEATYYIFRVPDHEEDPPEEPGGETGEKDSGVGFIIAIASIGALAGGLYLASQITEHSI